MLKRCGENAHRESAARADKLAGESVTMAPRSGA
jgi:hypothetical protein